MMLRTFVLVVAMLFFTAALIGAVVDPAVWPSVIGAILLLAGILFERRRYGASQAKPTGSAWRETTERFVDDASGRPVTVWYNDATGERRYVDPESNHPL
ncbi:hypothetical protein NDN01_00770 [Sphingomonas sp. QA11]|uniref:hypothetical protein n=1 Tax=Sphingomonas sp. QA11 TaxID=2950605 RepID=UPI002349384A|nr:hypothetical protein [Sphingomonas sp. QA11]WCM27501.1 hypothetical protein NDN01_00770 [Sphingomonas sp. QA11]